MEKEYKKSRKVLVSLAASCRVSKYLSSGQLEQLEKLQDYKRKHDVFLWECQDNWYI